MIHYKSTARSVKNIAIKKQQPKDNIFFRDGDFLSWRQIMTPRRQEFTAPTDPGEVKLWRRDDHSSEL